jgi:hypothetical protein
MVLRSFGLKREQVMGGWRKLHNEELYNLYSSPNIIEVIKSRRLRRLGHGYKILIGHSEGKRSLGRPRRRCKIILKWIRNRMGIFGLNSCGSE